MILTTKTNRCKGEVAGFGPRKALFFLLISLFVTSTSASLASDMRDLFDCSSDEKTCAERVNLAVECVKNGACEYADDDADFDIVATQRCIKLEERIAETGFIAPRVHTEMCDLKCPYFTCNNRESEPTWLNTWFNATFSGENWDTEKEINDMEFAEMNIPDDTIDAWGGMWWVFLPMLSVLGPLMMYQWKYYNLEWASVYIASYMVFWLFFGFIDWQCTVYLCAVALACLAMPANSSYVSDIAAWAVVHVVLLAMLVLTNIYWQIITVLSFFLLVGFVGWNLYHDRRSGSSLAIMVFVFQIFLFSHQLGQVNDEFKIYSIAFQALRFLISTILISGPRTYYRSNAALICRVLAKLLVDYFPTYRPYRIYTTLRCIHLVMFAGMRSMFGTYCIASLRFHVTPRTFVTGGFVYASDFFGPVRCLWRILSAEETFSNRRMAYGVTLMIVGYYECFNAYEVVVIRILVSSLSILFRLPYSHVTHQLSYDICYGGLAFPQVGSKAFMSLTSMVHLGKYTRKLEVVHSVKGKSHTSSATGFIRCKAPRRAQLLTVDHVLKPSMTSLSIGGGTTFMTKRKNVETLSKSDDPPVAMRLPDGVDGSTVDFLLASEREHVEQWVTLIPNGEDTVVNVLGAAKISGDRLIGVVDLMKGDSGTPIFGVFPDGSFQYAGVVSQGNFDQGSGNIYNLIDPTNVHTNSSDDEDVVPGFRGVAKFNQNRNSGRSAVKMANVHGHLNAYITEYNDIIARDEQSATQSAEAARVAAADASKLEGANKCSECGVDPCTCDPSRKKKPKIKSRNKDRAARKRELLNSVGVIAQAFYDKSIAEGLMTALSNGKLESIEEESMIDSVDDGGTFHYDDNPDFDNEW